MDSNTGINIRIRVECHQKGTEDLMVSLLHDRLRVVALPRPGDKLPHLPGIAAITWLYNMKVSSVEHEVALAGQEPSVTVVVRHATDLPRVEELLGSPESRQDIEGSGWLVDDLGKAGDQNRSKGNPRAMRSQ